MTELVLANSPEERSALRSQIFTAGADEIAKIGKVKKEDLIHGHIATTLLAIHSALGKSERDFEKGNPRVVSLISETLADVLTVRITGPVHAFNLAKKHIAEETNVLTKKACERAVTEKCVRRIAAKLLNGHAGTEI